MDNDIINPITDLEQLQEYVIKYKKFMDERNEHNKGNYSIDGAINLEKWNVSKYKILFVLKETAGYHKSRTFELQDELKSVWLKYNQKPPRGNKKIQNPTYKNVAWLAKSLQIALENNRILLQAEIKKMDTSPDSLINAIDYCAIINLNKYSNSSPDKKSINDVICSEYRANRELLEWQIKKLSPNVVVAGSSVVWECLSNEGNGLYKDIITSKLKVHECKSFNGIVFYRAYHPSAPRKYKWDIYKIHKQLFEEIKRTIG